MRVEKAMFVDFIKNTIATDGWRVADAANKIALENHRINHDTYSAAAREIVKAYMAE